MNTWGPMSLDVHHHHGPSAANYTFLSTIQTIRALTPWRRVKFWNTLYQPVGSWSKIHNVKGFILKNTSGESTCDIAWKGRYAFFMSPTYTLLRMLYFQRQLEFSVWNSCRQVIRAKRQPAWSLAGITIVTNAPKLTFPLRFFEIAVCRNNYRDAWRSSDTR